MPQCKGWIALVASLLLHGPLFWLAYQRVWGDPPAAAEAAPVVFTSRILSSQELDRMLKRHGAVVTSEAPERKDTRRPANYAAETTRRVDKETIARGRPGAPASHQALGASARRFGLQGVVQPESPVGGQTAPVERSAVGTGILRSPAGEGGSVDVVLSDVAQGSQTLLNTDEYVFASFFLRLKAQVEPRWSPEAREIMKRNWRSLPQGIYVTELSIGTDQDGKITWVEVQRSAGYSSFDEIAKRAVWEVERLVNLPRELLDRDSRYRTTLTFVVDFKKGRFDTLTENEENRGQSNVRKNR